MDGKKWWVHGTVQLSQPINTCIMKTTSKFPAELRAVAVAAALCAIGSPAWAATQVNLLQATAKMQLGGTTVVNTTQSRINPSGFAGVDQYYNLSSGSNFGSIHTFGSTLGNFGSLSYGRGVYDVSGAFKIVMTISNTTSVAQVAKFDFHITPGPLYNSIASPLTGSDFLTSGVVFDIKRDGATVWGSSATLNSTAAGTTFASSGVTDFYTGADTYYRVNGVDKSIDLGVINAGQSIELSYQIDSFARGSSVKGADRIIPETSYVIPAQWIEPCANGGYGYGVICDPTKRIFVPERTVIVPARTIPGDVSGSYSGTGDPFDIDLNGNVLIDANKKRSYDPLGFSVNLSPVVTAVPEPSTYALMFGGLGLMAWMARRRRS
jgi:PEP-CTERM motif